jgi:PKHD-type hydroxylase
MITPPLAREMPAEVSILRDLSSRGSGSPGGTPDFIATARGPMRTNPRAMGIYTERRAIGPIDCARALEAARCEPAERGEVIGQHPGSRRCHCAWLPETPRTAWLYDRVAAIFLVANRQFGFELAGIIEPVMAVAYGPGDGFDWHLDAGPELTANRKLSLSLLLTGANSYQGGNLEFLANDPQDLRLDAGTAIVFPSFLAHRVSPVTGGRRISLVAFAYGSTFR